MKPENIIEILNERIKELTCLYEISNIVALHHNSFEETMKAVVKAIPKAWKFPQSAVAEIRLTDKGYCSGPLYKKSVNQKEKILIEGQERGTLLIHYPAEKFDESSFLREERLLLQKLAREFGSIIERFEQKQREELMERRIQHSDRLTILGEITAGIAHELNTPLANILGFSQLIQENEKDEQVKSDVEKIIGSTIHAREVVKKLMFFSCEMPQQMQSVPINPLVESAIKLLGPSIQKSELAVDFIPLANDTLVQLDPIQMTQVVFNLLINAIYATPKGGKISVKLEANEKILSMKVKDSGSGIPGKIIDRIFEPFFSTKPVGEGSGLGLSVVHGIIKSHHGKIEVKSREGKGTTFIISLPLQQQL